MHCVLRLRGKHVKRCRQVVICNSGLHAHVTVVQITQSVVDNLIIEVGISTMDSTQTNKTLCCRFGL